MAVQTTHIRSNQYRTQFERTRMLFDFVRAAFASPRTACTDLSRRLRDGVSLSLSLSLFYPPHTGRFGDSSHPQLGSRPEVARFARSTEYSPSFRLRGLEHKFDWPMRNRGTRTLKNMSLRKWERTRPCFLIPPALHRTASAEGFLRTICR